MNKISIAGLLLSFIGSTSFAETFQTSKPIICASIKEILAVVKDDKLTGMFSAKDLQGESNYALFFNEKEKTWLFIQFNEKTACVLGGGVEGKLQSSKSI